MSEDLPSRRCITFRSRGRFRGCTPLESSYRLKSAFRLQGMGSTSHPLVLPAGFISGAAIWITSFADGAGLKASGLVSSDIGHRSAVGGKSQLLRDKAIRINDISDAAAWPLCRIRIFRKQIQRHWAIQISATPMTSKIALRHDHCGRRWRAATPTEFRRLFHQLSAAERQPHAIICVDFSFTALPTRCRGPLIEPQNHPYRKPSRAERAHFTGKISEKGVA